MSTHIDISVHILVCFYAVCEFHHTMLIVLYRVLNLFSCLAKVMLCLLYKIFHKSRRIGRNIVTLGLSSQISRQLWYLLQLFFFWHKHIKMYGTACSWKKTVVKIQLELFNLKLTHLDIKFQFSLSFFSAFDFLTPMFYE